MNDIPQGKIEDTDDAWDPNGPLGNDEAHVRVATDDVAAAVDAALGLQPISIRLQRDLLDNLKALAQLHGIGYQPLIRQVLTRFVDCEVKTMLRNRVEEKAAEKTEESTPESDHRRAA